LREHRKRTGGGRQSGGNPAGGDDNRIEIVNLRPGENEQQENPG